MEYAIDLEAAPGIIWVRISGEAEYLPSERALKEVWEVQRETGIHDVIRLRP